MRVSMPELEAAVGRILRHVETRTPVGVAQTSKIGSCPGIIFSGQETSGWSSGFSRKFRLKPVLQRLASARGHHKRIVRPGFCRILGGTLDKFQSVVQDSKRR